MAETKNNKMIVLEQAQELLCEILVNIEDTFGPESTDNESENKITKGYDHIESAIANFKTAIWLINADN